MSTVRVESIKPHIGGIVHIAKQHLLDDQTIAAVREALEHRGVLVFPRMNLTDAEQLAFTDKLGKRVNFTRKAQSRGATDDEDVYAITLDKKFNTQPEYVLGTFFWHIDGVTIDQPLPKATLLTARKLSPTGGQTEFASTYAAHVGSHGPPARLESQFGPQVAGDRHPRRLGCRSSDCPRPLAAGATPGMGRPARLLLPSRMAGR
jgi:alpha-ketoglutarate-dependent taurine dioxygenase